nr:GH25 family lysozyme [Clostridium sp. MCC353]
MLAAAICAVTPFKTLAAEPWTMENGQYVDASGTPIEGAVAKGITVTKYQNRANKETGIDWAKVREDGVSFAMVRLGYLKDQDPYFGINMQEASASGLKTGVFFYTQALDAATAEEEARYVLEVIKEYPVSYPVAYDVESQILLDNNLTKEQIADQINVFCRIISDAGYQPVVYANNMWLTEHIDVSRVPYEIWYARYGTNYAYPNRTIWQTTDKGSVAGIEGDVTIELAFKDYGASIPADGWKNINGRWYYMKNFVKQTGWIQDQEKQYYLDSNGIMIHDTTMVIDGVSYTFGSDGSVQ